METENNPTPRGLSDQQAVDALLSVPDARKKAPKGQAGDRTSDAGAEAENPQAIGQREAPEPTVESEEQAIDSLVEDDESEEVIEEQDALDETEDEDPDTEGEHSEESDEEVTAYEPKPTDVIFHDPEGNPVTAEEAHRGYLRQSDYTRKTQELSQQRDHVMQAYQQRQQEREVLAENINLALNVIEPTLAEYANVDWNKLASEDPHTYARTKAMYEQATERYQQLQQAGQQALQQSEQERQAKFQKQLAAHQKLAQRLIPDLADPKKAPQAKARMKAYLTKSAGFSAEEASRVSDARILNLVNKALQYDMLQASNRKVKGKKVQPASRRALKPGTPTTQAQRQEKLRAEQTAKLRRTGKLADAVDLLLK